MSDWLGSGWGQASGIPRLFLPLSTPLGIEMDLIVRLPDLIKTRALCLHCYDGEVWKVKLMVRIQGKFLRHAV